MERRCGICGEPIWGLRCEPCVAAQKASREWAPSAAKAHRRPPSATRRRSKTETAHCEDCGSAYTRSAGGGTRAHYCPSCRRARFLRYNAEARAASQASSPAIPPGAGCATCHVLGFRGTCSDCGLEVREIEPVILPAALRAR